MQILLIFLCTRLALYLLIGYAALAVSPNQTLFHAVASSVCSFDCGWFRSIAEGGYSSISNPAQPWATNYAFFPLFPMLWRAGMATGIGGLKVAICLCNLIFLIALVYVYKYARLIGGSRSVALGTVTLLCTLPQTIIFSVPYSDSLFLLLLVGSIYALRTEHFLISGICAALLSATRANGIFFIIFAVVWIWRRFGWDGFVRPWRISEAYIPVVFAPLGLFLFWAFCFVSTGDAFAFSSTEFHGWGWRFTQPLSGLIASFRIGGIHAFAAFVSLGVLALSFQLIRYGLVEECVYCVACVLLIWSSQSTGSVFRYWLLMFPVWYVVARQLENRPIPTAVTISVASLCNGALTCAWALQNNFGI